MGQANDTCQLPCGADIAPALTLLHAEVPTFRQMPHWVVHDPPAKTPTAARTTGTELFPEGMSRTWTPNTSAPPVTWARPRLVQERPPSGSGFAYTSDVVVWAASLKPATYTVDGFVPVSRAMSKAPETPPGEISATCLMPSEEPTRPQSNPMA